jgi:formate-dependent nitrite reductase membrane component NrfD
MTINIQQLDSSGKSTREEARRQIANKLITCSIILIIIAIIVGAILLGFDKITPENFINLILVVSAVFSGLLGSAVTFYYSAQN